MKVVVYGGRHYNNVTLLYESFYELQKMGLTRLTVPRVHGGPMLMAKVSQYAGVETLVLEPQWLIHGHETEARLRGALMERGDPELVVLLPGQPLEVADMRRVCNAYDVPVWDLTELPWVPLGSGNQLGDSPGPGGEPF